MKEELATAESAAEAVAKDYKPWQPVREKAPLLEARRRLESLKTDLAVAFAETVKYLEAALVAEAGNATARSALAELWRGRLTDAERQGDKADAAYALAMIGRYDDGALAKAISGEGTLSLASDPSGAEVTLHRLVETDGVLGPDAGRELGATPVGPVELPTGSYLAVLTKPGYRAVRYPVWISRNREWTGRVKMRTEEEIGEGFVYVPGGPFVYGVGKETKEIELPDFAIAKYPVTFGEYAEFLDSIPEEEAAERLPRTEMLGPMLEIGPDGKHRPKASLIAEESHAARCRRDFGEDFLRMFPVVCVNWNDAQAYCEWRARETGREWRLPTEEEREKAARGVDGRQFPWGDVEDSSLARCRDSRDEHPQPEPVGAFPTAASVYGMGDAAGNVCDWTDSWFTEHRSLRVVRGGSWFLGTSALKCGFRSGGDPHHGDSIFGFRCARGLP